MERSSEGASGRTEHDPTTKVFVEQTERTRERRSERTRVGTEKTPRQSICRTGRAAASWLLLDWYNGRFAAMWLASLRKTHGCGLVDGQMDRDTEIRKYGTENEPTTKVFVEQTDGTISYNGRRSAEHC